jgi:uncharacterized membrane protein
VADNQSQWPAEHPGYGWPAADPGPQAPPGAAADQIRPAEPQIPPAPSPAPPTAYQVQVPPAGYQIPPPGYQIPPGGYHIPPGGYQVPPAGYQVPPGGYQVAPPGYQVPHAGYQVQANASMRAASADRERAVDVLKAGFTEGRLTQDEYNDRMGRAYAARTYGELTALTADLPAGVVPTMWQAPPVYQPPMSTNSLARTSMILGVAEFFSMGLTAVPAVICGHIAKREMRLTGQRGDGLATTGLVLGYMAIIFWAVIIVLAVLGAAISIGQGGPGPGG